MSSTARATTLLREMVEICSPSGEERAIGEYLVDRMRGLGFDAALDRAGNAVGTLGSGRRTVMLLGHMDTVPGIIPVEVRDGQLWGRGTVDAKGPLATFISAAAAYGPPKDAQLVIIGAVEEEAQSAGARFVVQNYARPDYVIIGEPSGWNHVTLGYKGSLALHYQLEGDIAHSAGSGATATEQAVSFWNRLQAWAEAFNQGKERQFDMITPTLRSINSASDGLTERVTMGINVRWPLGADIEAFEAWLRREAAPATIETTSWEVPYRSDKRTPLVGAFLASIRQLGGRPSFKLKTGTSDMNVVGPAWGCPIVAYGPGDSSLDHTPHEHIDLQEYAQAIEVLGRVLSIL